MIRAVLLASATVISMRDLGVSIRSKHDPAEPLCAVQRTTPLAPMINRWRSALSQS